MNRMLLAGVLTLAVSMGGTTLGVGVAGAQPNNGLGGEWDIAQFDNCVNSYPYPPMDDGQRWLDHVQWCCLKSGGIWQNNTCIAPPADGGNLQTLVPMGPGPVASQPIQPRPVTAAD
jgi:hypothetical protein